MEMIKCIQLEKENARRRGWAKSLTSLLSSCQHLSAVVDWL